MVTMRGSSKAKRVSCRQRRRDAEQALNLGGRAVLVLLTVLAQQGGEAVVTQGTLDQCARTLIELDYEVVGTPDPKEFKVRLISTVSAEDTLVATDKIGVIE